MKKVKTNVKAKKTVAHNVAIQVCVTEKQNKALIKFVRAEGHRSKSAAVRALIQEKCA